MTPHRTSPARAVALILMATAFIAVTTLLAKAAGGPHLGAPLHPRRSATGGSFSPSP